MFNQFSHIHTSNHSTCAICSRAEPLFVVSILFSAWAPRSHSALFLLLPQRLPVFLRLGNFVCSAVSSLVIWLAKSEIIVRYSTWCLPYVQASKTRRSVRVVVNIFLMERKIANVHSCDPEAIDLAYVWKITRGFLPILSACRHVWLPIV